MRLYQEELVNAIASVLQLNMSTVLAAAATAAGDGVTLDNIAEYQKAWLQLLNRKKYPAIGIQPAFYDFEQAGYQAMDGEYNFSIVCAVSDSNLERLQKKLLRYGEVIREIIQRNPTLGGACIYAYPTGGEIKPAPSGVAISTVNIRAKTEIR